MAEKKCPKCSNTELETDEMSATSGFGAKFFNIQNKKFTIVSCTKCGYTELYKKGTSMGENVLDFFGN